MADHREVDFIDIDAFLPTDLPPAVRNPRIARLESEVAELKERCETISDDKERARMLLKGQRAINEDLRQDLDRQKVEIEGLQSRYQDAIDRMRAQESDLVDRRNEIGHLERLVRELQHLVDELRSLQLQTRTYETAVRVLYNLLRQSHPQTSIGEILAACQAQVLAVDAGNRIYYPQAVAIGENNEGMDDGIPTVGDFIDDNASEASRDDSIADDDSLHDFVDYGEDIQRSPSRQKKRKRTMPDSVKRDSDNKDFHPRTPKRARTSNMGAPMTPPSSQRKKLPRKAKVTSNGSSFYNLKRLSDACHQDQ